MDFPKLGPCVFFFFFPIIIIWIVRDYVLMSENASTLGALHVKNFFEKTTKLV